MHYMQVKIEKVKLLSVPSSMSNSAVSTPRQPETEELGAFVTESGDGPDSDEEREELNRRVVPGPNIDITSLTQPS